MGKVLFLHTAKIFTTLHVKSKKQEQKFSSFVPYNVWLQGTQEFAEENAINLQPNVKATFITRILNCKTFSLNKEYLT